MALSPSARPRDDPPVVVTGADGFVGAALCAHLRATARRFRGLRRGGASEGDAGARYLAVGDLCTASDAALAAALEGAGAVVHLAARAHVAPGTGAAAERAFHGPNVEATERIAQAAVRAGVPRFVFTSTVKVLGESTPPKRPFRDADAPQPADAYARSKREAERVLEDLAAEARISVSILRPPLVYGPNVRGNFLALWRAVARGVPLPLAGIENRRHLLYVGNLVHAIAALIDAPTNFGGTWLAADHEAVSTPELARRIGAALGRPARLLPVPQTLLAAGARLLGRADVVGRLAGSLEVDATALAERIGPPPFTLDQGLAATARWWSKRQ